MDEFRLESVSVDKIINGFILSQSGYRVNEAGKDEWKDVKVFCSTIDEITEKLREIYKDK